eukprot:Rmarinus@m.12280
MSSYVSFDTGSVNVFKEKSRLHLTILVILTLVCVLFIVLILVGHFDSDSNDEQLSLIMDPSRLDRYVEEVMACYGAIGLSLVVVEGDEIVYSKGFGMRDIEESLPVNEDTLFQIGSVTKSITAQLIAEEIVAGHLDLDAPISDYVADPTKYFNDPITANRVSLRDLLSHRTGVPRYDVLWFAGASFHGYDRDTILDTMHEMRQGSDFRTDSEFNNFMYMLAGSIVAERAGFDSWEDMVQARILDVVGMNSTKTSCEAAVDTGNYAFAYGLNTAFQNVRMRDDFNSNLDVISASSGISANAKDMGQWLKVLLADGFLHGEQVLTPEAIALTREHSSVVGPSLYDSTLPEFPVISLHPNWALGYKAGLYREYKSIQHGGTATGILSYINLLPEAGVGVFVANSGLLSDLRLNRVVAEYALDVVLGFEPYLSSSTACDFPCSFVQCDGDEFGDAYSAIPASASMLSRAYARGILETPASAVFDSAPRESAELDAILEMGAEQIAFDLTPSCDFAFAEGTYEHPFLGQLHIVNNVDQCKMDMSYYNMEGYAMKINNANWMKLTGDYEPYLSHATSFELYKLPGESDAGWVFAPEMEAGFPPVFTRVGDGDGGGSATGSSGMEV